MEMKAHILVFVGFLALTSAAPYVPTCDAEGHHLPLHSISNGIYYFSDMYGKFSWNYANEFCKANGMELVTFSDELEMGAVAAYTMGAPVWTSGNFKNGIFSWATGKTIPLDSELWSEVNEEPNDYVQVKQSCVFMDDVRLYDDNCQAQRPFICEFSEICYNAIKTE